MIPFGVGWQLCWMSIPKPYFSAGTDRRKSNLSGPWTLHTRGLILSLKSYLYQQIVISFLPSIIPYWLWFYCDWWWATSHSICSHHFLLAHTSPHPPTYLHPQLWMNASKVSLRIFYLYSIEITQSAKNFLDALASLGFLLVSQWVINVFGKVTEFIQLINSCSSWSIK